MHKLRLVLWHQEPYFHSRRRHELRITPKICSIPIRSGKGFWIHPLERNLIKSQVFPPVVIFCLLKFERIVSIPEVLNAYSCVFVISTWLSVISLLCMFYWLPHQGHFDTDKRWPRLKAFTAIFWMPSKMEPTWDQRQIFSFALIRHLNMWTTRLCLAQSQELQMMKWLYVCLPIAKGRC